MTNEHFIVWWVLIIVTFVPPVVGVFAKPRRSPEPLHGGHAHDEPRARRAGIRPLLQHLGAHLWRKDSMKPNCYVRNSNADVIKIL